MDKRPMVVIVAASMMVAFAGCEKKQPEVKPAAKPDATKSLTDAAKDITGKATDAAKGVADKAGQAATDATKVAADAADKAKQAATDAASEAKQKAVSGMQSMYDGAKSQFDELAKKVSGMGVTSPEKPVYQGLLDGIKGELKEAEAKLASMKGDNSNWQTLSTELTTILSKVTDGLKGLAGKVK